MNSRPNRRTLIKTALVGGALIGAVSLTAAGTATAAGVAGTAVPTSTISTSSTGSAGGPGPAAVTDWTEAAGVAGSSPGSAVTGAALASVKAAVSAKYPGATFGWVSTDDGGGYRAQVITTAGEHLGVELNKAFVITGTLGSGGHGFGRGGGASRGSAVTGAALASVKAAVTAKYPGASLGWVSTDGGGYRAQITTTAGEHLGVELNKTFVITGTK